MFQSNNLGESEAKEAANQRLRLRSLRMSALSYLGILVLVGFCWVLGAFPLRVVFEYAALVGIVVGLSYWAFKSRLNLRFRDPSLTLLQTGAAFLPTLWAMYWAEALSARAALLIVSTLPPLYGVLALNTRQLFQLAAFFVGAYSLLLLLLWLIRPARLEPGADTILLFAFAMVMLQTAIIGGYISRLRKTLRSRNNELRSTTKDLSEALRTISELAIRDPLTNVFNRRQLFTLLGNEIERFNRAENTFPLSVAILDIDFFKRVNDTYGHQAGDEILRQIADTAQQLLRNIDSCARYGGEEFVLVFPQTTLEGAVTVAERLRQVVTELTFPQISDTLRVSISIGVAEYQHPESIDDLIARADQALYAAKHNGRNRVETA